MSTPHDFTLNTYLLAHCNLSCIKVCKAHGQKTEWLCLHREEPGIAAKLAEMEKLGIGWVGQLCRRPVGSRKMLPGQSFLAAVGSVDHVGLNYEMCCRRRGKAQVRGWKPHPQDCLLLNKGLHTNQLVMVELICCLCQASANDNSSALLTELRKKVIFFVTVSPCDSHSSLVNST